MTQPRKRIYIGKVFDCPAHSIADDNCVCRPNWGHRSFTGAPLPPPQARTPDAEMTKSEHVPKFSIKIEAGESLLSVLTLPGKYFRVYQNSTLLTLTKDSNAVFDLLRKFLAAPEPNYVANSGELAGISDRVDLTKNSSLSRAESAPQEAAQRPFQSGK